MVTFQTKQYACKFSFSCAIFKVTDLFHAKWHQNAACCDLAQFPPYVAKASLIHCFRFWGLMAYLANTMIFLIAGVAITEKSIQHLQGTDVMYIVITYIGITTIRYSHLYLIIETTKKCDSKSISEIQ